MIRRTYVGSENEVALPNGCDTNNCQATGPTSNVLSRGTSAAPDLDDLHHQLRLPTARLRHKPHVLRGCVTHCGYAF